MLPIHNRYIIRKNESTERSSPVVNVPVVTPSFIVFMFCIRNYISNSIFSYSTERDEGAKLKLG